MSSGAGDAIDSCVEALEADYFRQGRLSVDDVDRAVDRRELPPDEATRVWRRIAPLLDADEAEIPEIARPPRRTPAWEDPLVELLAHRILTPQEERTLARRIALRERALGDGEWDEADLERMVDQLNRGREARDTMILANVRLAFDVARRYQGRGLPLEDLLQEGILGLMRALETFDHSMGYKLSTYATWWIRQTITRAIADKGRVVRLPVHMVEQVARLRRARYLLFAALDRQPVDEELADELGEDPEKVRLLTSLERDAVSLDWNFGDGDDAFDLHDVVGDPNTDLEFEEVDDRIVRERLLDEIAVVLTPIEAQVLAHRVGLGGLEVCTLQELGDRFGVTRERIRQIEAKAIRKLRGSPVVADLLRVEDHPLHPPARTASERVRRGEPTEQREIASQPTRRRRLPTVEELLAS